MQNLIEKLFFSELNSAASKHFTSHLVVSFLGCLMLAMLSLFVTRDGGFGALFAGLLFWHRYVMLKVSKVYLDAMPAGSDGHGSDAGDTSNQ